MATSRCYCMAQVGDGHCPSSIKGDLNNLEMPSGWAYGIDYNGTYNVVCKSHAVVGTRLVGGAKVKRVEKP